jgi:serine/threonine-protein kinase
MNGHGRTGAAPAVAGTGSVLVAAPPVDDIDRTDIVPLPPGFGTGPYAMPGSGPYAPPGSGPYPPPGSGPYPPSGTGELPPGARRGPRRWIVTTLVVVAAVTIGAVGAIVVQRTSVPSHTVPNGLIGRQYSEINELVGDYGWRIDVEETRRDGTEAGEILDTDPAPGDDLREGDTLTVVRSLGPTLVEVPPDLAGLSQEDAEARLAAPGTELAADIQPEASEDVDEGVVIRVDTGPAQVPKGSAVTLVVSSGPPPRVVPEIEGRSYDDVAGELEGMGLVVERDTDPEADGEPGEVVDSDPDPGEEVDRGDTVTLTVAIGDVVSVPDLSGLDRHDAEEALKDVGLKAGVVIGRGSGTVFATLPIAGSELSPGGEVQLFMR